MQIQQTSRPAKPADPDTVASEQTSTCPTPALASAALSTDQPLGSYVLCAIRARQALGMCGCMMCRSTGGSGGYSFAVQKIDEFWSHSWHAGWWSKMTTLWLYYNGAPAALAGVLMAFVSGFFAKNQEIAILVGLASLYAVAAFWPIGRRVFLDKACIPQDSDADKRAGILSLGFILRSSRTMLCLWDDTYFTRWCVFECAAFLHLREQGHAGRIVVMPTYYGFLAWCISASCFAYKSMQVVLGYLELENSFVVELSCSLVALVCCVILLWRFVIKRARAFMVQKQRLLDFCMDSARSYCCDVGHVHPESGGHLQCDRLLIEQAVKDWFSSIPLFESYVASIVSQRVPDGAVMPYRYLVVACSPLLHVQVYRWVGGSGGVLKCCYDAAVYGLFEAMFSGPVVWNVMFKAFNLVAMHTLTTESKLSTCIIFSAALVCILSVGALFAVETLMFTLFGFYEALAILSLIEGVILVAVYLPRRVRRKLCGCSRPR